MASDKDNAKTALIGSCVLLFLSICAGIAGVASGIRDLKVGGSVMAAVFFGMVVYFSFRYKNASTSDNRTKNTQRTAYRCEFCSARYDSYNDCALHEQGCHSNPALHQPQPVGGYYQNPTPYSHNQAYGNQAQYGSQEPYGNQVLYAQPIYNNQPQYPQNGNVVVGVPVNNGRY